MKKPCPFCGADNSATRIIPGASPPCLFMACNVCEAHGPEGISEPAAYSLWNERADGALEKAESALISHGYKKSCDIPACNCGDQWTHGGHAERQLELLQEKLDSLGAANKEAHVRAQDAYLAGIRHAARLADDALSERLKLNTGQQVNAAIHTRDWIVNRIRTFANKMEKELANENGDFDGPIPTA